MAIPLLPKAWIGNREMATQWKFHNGRMDQSAHTLVLTFTSAEPKLLLRSMWRARPGRGPVEHWIEIENRSAARVAISHQDSLSLHGLKGDGSADLWWIKRGGSNASAQGGTFRQPLDKRLDLKLVSHCEDGASPVPWLAVQVGQKQGLYVGWEFSGLGRIHARAAKNEGQLDLDVGNLPDFRTDIEPGEVFWVPTAFVGCYAGDVDEGSYRLHRFVLEKLRPAFPRESIPIRSWPTTFISTPAEPVPRKPTCFAAPRRAANWGSRPSWPTPCGSPRRAIGGGTRSDFPRGSCRSNGTCMRRACGWRCGVPGRTAAPQRFPQP